MVENAPDLEMRLTDWDENPRVALRSAISAMLDNDNEIQTYQSIWYDFYRDAPLEYLKKMPLLGIDGIKVDRAEGATHYIIYDPACIQIINRTLNASLPE